MHKKLKIQIAIIQVMCKMKISPVSTHSLKLLKKTGKMLEFHNLLNSFHNRTFLTGAIFK